MSMSFERIDELGQERCQAFGADPVSSFPEDDQGNRDFVVVASRASAGGLRRWFGRGVVEQPGSGLAMIACSSDQLVEDAFLVGFAGLMVSLSDGFPYRYA